MHAARPTAQRTRAAHTRRAAGPACAVMSRQAHGGGVCGRLHSARRVRRAEAPRESAWTQPCHKACAGGPHASLDLCQRL